MSGRERPAVGPRFGRGSVYLATLGAAMIVTVVGLSTLLVARIRQGVGQGTERAAKAHYHAISVVDLGHFLICHDPNWRTMFVNDAWTPNQAVGEATCCYKLADEQDGDLADDPSDPARLYGKATVGQAVRIYSVLLQSPGWSGNLLTNGDMDLGATDWSGLGYCDLEPYIDDAGDGYIWVKNRDACWAGPQQNVTDRIAAGVSYGTQVWVKMKDQPEAVTIRLYVSSSDGGSRWFDCPPVTVGHGWTKVSGAVTPTWAGALVEAFWKVETTSTAQEFKIDDALLVDPSQTLVIKPGTWRQEVIPEWGGPPPAHPDRSDRTY